MAIAAMSPRLAPAALPESLCADGRDDDADGRTDCSDADCVSDLACSGQDFDRDGVANGVDCAPLDAGSIALPPEVPLLLVGHPGAADTDALVSWDDVAGQGGTATVYQLVSGGIARMWQDRGLAAATIVAEGRAPSFVDPRLTGVDADGWWYLVRTGNGCGSGDTGSGTLDDDPPFDEAPTNCDDRLDNDGNGRTDCADPACTDAPGCIEICDNGRDDDADGRVDCDDPECIGACPELGQCANGVDDDADGDTDCFDTDCAGDPACCSSCPSPMPQVLAPTPDCQTVAGVIGPCPSSFYSFLTVAGRCYQFSTCSCDGTAAFDAALTIRRGDCVAPLAGPGEACSDGSGTILRWVAPLSGRFVIEVSALAGGTGAFLLSHALCNEAGSCADGVDNDDDALVDCDDPECTDDPLCPEDCANGADDDGNGWEDCADPECIGDPACPETGHCEDAIDNDGDDLTDCDDPDCAASIECRACLDCPDGDPIPPPLGTWQVVHYETTLRCPVAYLRTDVVPGLCYRFGTCAPGSAGFDSVVRVWSVPDCRLLASNDDFCGWLSMAQLTVPAGVTEVVVEVDQWPSARAAAFDLAYRKCPDPEGPVNCADGIDNDEDGRIDCEDMGCMGAPDCPEAGNCDDGVDNDWDGLRDCADPDCLGDAACPETGNCADALDNDADGFTDCADADCDTDPACCSSCARPVATLPNPTDAYQTIAGDTTGICPTDYYELLMIGGSCYELATCPPGIANADSILTIRTPSCTLVSSNDDACGTSSRVLYMPVTTGTHVVGVAAASGGPMSYVLAWRVCAVEDDATECGNGIDDDFDGLTDCADAGCTGVPPC